MSEEIREYTDLEEEYLDLLIRLAYDMDDLDKTQQILAEAEEEVSAPDEETIRRTWQAAEEKIDRLEKEEKRRNRVIAFRKAVPQVLKVAACLLLALCIGVPVVLASSAEFRSRVIELLMSVDRENEVVHFDFVENPDAAFAVPGAWNGDYFISWVPEGFEETWCSQFANSVSYSDADGHRFGFSENDEGVALDTGLEEQTVGHTDINGAAGHILSGTSSDGAVHTNTIVWTRDEKWFELVCYNMPMEDSLRIAESVRKIIR